MPNELIKNLIREVGELRASLDAHLADGVNVKLSIAKVQTSQEWVKLLGLIIFTAIAGLYLKK